MSRDAYVPLALALFAAACGGSSPTTPSTPPSSGGNSATTITISASGVSPKTITVTLGARVTFVNGDSRSHDMTSDPHPDHTDCPELNQVGFLTAGQSRESGNLVTVRTCGFHDHDQPSNANLKGTITIRSQ
ncbi:MAG: hypothetical protein U0Q12_04655 [Vicinamibacterales bacterium]